MVMELNKINTITASEAARSFSEIINKVYYRHQAYEIKKGKTIMARITPSDYASNLQASELNNFFSNAPQLNKEEVEDFINDINLVRKEIQAREVKWE